MKLFLGNKWDFERRMIDWVPVVLKRFVGSNQYKIEGDFRELRKGANLYLLKSENKAYYSGYYLRYWLICPIPSLCSRFCGRH